MPVAAIWLNKDPNLYQQMLLYRRYLIENKPNAIRTVLVSLAYRLEYPHYPSTRLTAVKVKPSQNHQNFKGNYVWLQ